MHTQHVKFSTYVAWGGGVGGVVAVGVVFEEGELSGLEEDDADGSVFEVVAVVVVVVFWLPPSSFFLLLLLLLLLDFIVTIEGLLFCFSFVN
jgi:hypothetical protein